MFKSSLLIVGAALLGMLWYISPMFKPFPELTGPHKVGTDTMMWTDVERTETYASNPNEKRSLMVRFWYPADDISSAQPYFYLGKKLPYFQKLLSARYGVPELASKYLLPAISTHTYVDAPISPSKNMYPVILFSHGLLGFPSDMYVAILENLASNGYIVVGIDHPYLNMLTLYPNGNVVSLETLSDQFNKASTEEQKEFQSKAIDVYKLDMKFVIDQLALLNENQSSIFYHKLDLAHIGIMGHSAGGTAAIEFCRMDKRCKAAADLDGWYDHVIGYEPINTPLLLMFGSKSIEVSEPTPEYLKRKNLTQEQYYERERKIKEHKEILCEKSIDCTMIIVPDAEHGDFSDEALFKWPLRAFSAADGYVLLATINEHILKFFDAHFK